MLTDHAWKLKYTPEDGNLVHAFYVPALQDAARYDRLTGYFNAGALALAARGVEGLVRNEGRMRLIVGCTLDPPEVEAIKHGERLRDLVERRLVKLPLAPPDKDAAEAVELLAWMIGQGHLDVRVAVPCDAERQPVGGSAIFHEKSGVIEDRGGNRIAWTGSLNETAAGWQQNWESINVYRSWGPEPERVRHEEQNFAKLWADRSPRAIVLNVPDAARQELLRFLPQELPVRLEERTAPTPVKPKIAKTKPEAALLSEHDRREIVWSFIKQAPSLPGGGAQVGEATAAITPWPHQIRAFERLYDRWPPRLLIADEVGLGKTIQAGMLLRQAWLAGRAKRILILTPKAVLKQWQIELREKFNLNWPIYDDGKLSRYPSRASGDDSSREVGTNEWYQEPVVLASSQLMRRRERATTLLEDAEPWDLVVLDEAHHARRQSAKNAAEGRPNALLKLMRGLKDRTQGLVLLTATPMQVHPIEVWDLLNLVGLPAEWTAPAFLEFFEHVNDRNPSAAKVDQMAGLFQAVEREYGKTTRDTVEHMTDLRRIEAGKVLEALRDESTIPRRRLETGQRRAAVMVMRKQTPLRHLISRHTRELLRRYANAGMLSTPVPNRSVGDEFIEMSVPERELYEEVEAYISETYKKATGAARSAVGFVMTVYRRRLASSFAALRATLEKHRKGVIQGTPEAGTDIDEDMPDDEALDEVLNTDEVAVLLQQGIAFADREEIERLLTRIAALPPDSKLTRLTDTLDQLAHSGYKQVMVFSQYTDTMDFLRRALRERGGERLLCYSGRGGERPDSSKPNGWQTINREEVKRRFRNGDADLLLCTEAAGEGLNFQFCGALVNYDMPWNPMKVEQRIGRIDRLGQRHATIRIVNLHYEDTVETNIYRALRERIGLFQQVVGRLQPILAQMPKEIANTVLEKGHGAVRDVAREEIEERIARAEEQGFDIDTGGDTEVTMAERGRAAVTLNDLDRIIKEPKLMPPGTEVRPLRPREYSLLKPGMTAPIRVTTDAAYYEAHSDSVELWSPGNPLFEGPELLGDRDDFPSGTTLKDLLDG